MRSNRSQDTQPELTLRKALWMAGLRGYRKNVRRYKGSPDIVFGRARIAIFVHGCFWHRHRCENARVPTQNAAFWKAKFERNAERHLAAVEDLTSKGFCVLTVWECEIKADLEAIVGRIAHQLGGVL